MQPKTKKSRPLFKKPILTVSFTVPVSKSSWLTEKIALLQNNIDEADQQIGDLEVEIDSQYEQFKNQIRSSYMSPEYSFLEYLLGSESFADFSVRMETVTRISEHDQSVINQLETQISDLHTLQESLAADKADLGAAPLSWNL